MARSIAAVGLRFALAAAIYLGVTLAWISGMTGWRALDALARTVIFGIVAAASLLAAIAIGRRIASPTARLIVQPLLMLLLFLALGYVVVGAFMGMHNTVGMDIRPFVALVAAIAAVDAAAGHWLDRWVERRTGEAR
jgi:hypothetical protein